MAVARHAASREKNRQAQRRFRERQKTTIAALSARCDAFEAALAAVEHIYLKELMQTDDAKEGLQAFLDKRKPVWRNA